jgi:predicted nucleic-acid-binding Zn-ribbon protein
MEKKCPKCSGETIEGRIPSPLKYLFGFKSDDQKQFSFESNVQKASACTACGYVEFYLDPEELKAKQS